ncbi:CWF21 domain-containing protein [Entamoeba marina]
MYNNLGLKTARGTGTSGYVQMNNAGSHFYSTKPNKPRRIDDALTEHETKRKIEVLVVEWAEKNLKDVEGNVAEEEMEKQRQYYRKKIEREVASKKRELDRLKRVCKVRDEDETFDIERDVVENIIKKDD